jgi:hypothetical protein
LLDHEIGRTLIHNWFSREKSDPEGCSYTTRRSRQFILLSIAALASLPLGKSRSRRKPSKAQVALLDVSIRLLIRGTFDQVDEEPHLENMNLNRRDVDMNGMMKLIRHIYGERRWEEPEFRILRAIQVAVNTNCLFAY